MVKTRVANRCTEGLRKVVIIRGRRSAPSGQRRVFPVPPSKRERIDETLHALWCRWVPTVGREAHLDAKGRGLLVQGLGTPRVCYQHTTAAANAHEVMIEREQCRGNGARAIRDPALILPR